MKIEMRVPMLVIAAAMSCLVQPDPVVAFLQPQSRSVILSFRRVSGKCQAISAEQADKDLVTGPVICGGGPAGLLSAIMMAQKFPDKRIDVYDSLPEPPNVDDDDIWSDVAKFYTIGVFGRGKNALNSFGVWEDVKKASAEVVGSQTWRSAKMNATTMMFEDIGREPMCCIPRDKLVSVIYQHILSNYADQIHLHYGYRAEPLDFDHQDGAVLLEISKCIEGNNAYPNTTGEECDVDGPPTRVLTEFLIGADGAARTVANRMEEVDREDRSSVNIFRRALMGRPFRVKRFIDNNQRVYKTIPVQVPSHWRYDFSYTVNEKKRRFGIVALPANSQGGYCAVLLLKKDEPLAQPDTDPKELRAMLDDVLSPFSELLDDETVASIAKKPPSNFPFYRYAGPRLHKGDRTVILGDAAHTLKPYNGLGVNSGFEDVKILGDIIDRSKSFKDAVKEFSRERAADAKALVTLSRSGDQPGFKGFISFIVPIMMDAVFYKAAPKLFTPPVPALIQNADYRFHQVGRRKRLDRIAQLLIIGFTTFGLIKASFVMAMWISKNLRKSSIAGAIALSSFFFLSLMKRKLASPTVETTTS